MMHREWADMCRAQADILDDVAHVARDHTVIPSEHVITLLTSVTEVLRNMAKLMDIDGSGRA